jgi:DNA-binding NtrC family response regulator
MLRITLLIALMAGAVPAQADTLFQAQSSLELTLGARGCGRIIGAMAACGHPRSEQEPILARCMAAIPSSAIEDLMYGVEEGAALAPNARGWSCREVQSAVRNLQ